ncbi:MAG: sulfurtransferase-like selenium metabolism protein YedF [Deltaproteobacteria bacterium]|nr:sulfurtransferase-like selenium metabolism protein YedF [Deltaproteobacteria bacterium]
MTNELDCRGQACPAPVLQAKEVLEKDAPDALTVIVDNEAAWQNVSRFLEYRNFQVSIEKSGHDFRVVGTRTGEDVVATDNKPAPAPEPAAGDRHNKKILVMVTTDRIGHGDDKLGAGLLINFLKTLKEMGPDLWCLVLLNSGVTLTAAGSAAVPILQELAGEGVRVLVCGTCLEFYKLLDKKQVGETTNMLDIVTGMQLADSVINI